MRSSPQYEHTRHGRRRSVFVPALGWLDLQVVPNKSDAGEVRQVLESIKAVSLVLGWTAGGTRNRNIGSGTGCWKPGLGLVYKVA